jgi:hypothetical protein
MKVVRSLDRGVVVNVKGLILEIETGGENVDALVQGAGGVELGAGNLENEQKRKIDPAKVTLVCPISFQKNCLF